MTDPSRRDTLLRAKLRALVRTRWAAALDRARDGSLPGGAALVSGATAWALAEHDASRSLGPALAWARKAGASELHLLASADTGVLARRAPRFSPDVQVWRVEGTALVVAEPDPLPGNPPLAPGAEAFRGLLEQAGTDPVVEQGILRGEVLGLEVARVVPGEDGGLRLEVGVGRHDRDMHRETSGLHHGMDELFEVVRIVAEHRRLGGDGEAYHLAPERWLRAILLRRPELVGAARLEPVPSPVVRTDLRRAAPAPAAGEDASGRPVLVVASAGLDLDVMSAAADAWLAFAAGRDASDARFVLCLPANDAYPAVRDLASLHVPPAEVVTVPADWRSL